jgi:putative phage-type endonuclease
MTQTITGPVGVIGWDLSDDDWRAARVAGFGGSDIAAVLGFSGYRSPWDVWAEKHQIRHWDDGGSEVADLGTELEPWLVGQAAKHLGVEVVRPEWRTYAHPEFPWRRCSPDGVSSVGLVEAKTAGLMSFRPAMGWDDGGIPLAYEFQSRWTLHVMDRPTLHLVGLVAGKGLVHRTITRDLAVEREMVAQVSDWWQRHIVEGDEPPIGATDNDTLLKLYPKPNGEAVDLDGTEAVEHWIAYRAARDAEKAAKEAKEAAGAALKELLGDCEVGVVENREIAKWSAKKGNVDWPAVIADLVEKHGIPAPNPEAYRKPSSRYLTIKEG